MQSLHKDILIDRLEQIRESISLIQGWCDTIIVKIIKNNLQPLDETVARILADLRI